MTCNHKWVHYQPFRGESYTCCANADCGVTYLDWLKAEKEAMGKASFAKWPAEIQEQVEKIKKMQEEMGAQRIITIKPGWTPVDFTDYMCPILPTGSKL